MSFLERFNPLNRFSKEFRAMTTALDAVAAKITNLEAKADAAAAAQTEAATELKALRTDLAAALANNDTAALGALGDRIDAVASKLDASSAALTAAEVPAVVPAPAPVAAPTDAPASPPVDPGVTPVPTT